MSADPGMQRADARRNRERIIAVAREVFAEQGIAEASLNDIARRAGIGPGTLWRHFAGRDALVSEVVGQSLDDLAASAERRVRDDPPGAAVAAWTEELVHHVLRHRGLAQEAAAGNPGGPLGQRCKAVEVAAAALVDRARITGEIHPDLTSATLFQVGTALAWVFEQALARGEHPDLGTLLSLTFHGLLTTPAPR